MTRLDDIGMKIGAKADKLKGKAKRGSGRPLSGTLDEVKGNIKDAIADIKLQRDDSDIEGRDY